ncbi:hypothetical protein HAX54_021079, partial [Datura stramonium]|nr:hypothetical protein [Datura stramonium]
MAHRCFTSRKLNVLVFYKAPAVCRSLPAAHRSSVGAASFFMIIPPLVSHIIFRVVI